MSNVFGLGDDTKKQDDKPVSDEEQKKAQEEKQKEKADAGGCEFCQKRAVISILKQGPSGLVLIQLLLNILNDFGQLGVGLDHVVRSILIGQSFDFV